MIVLSLRVQVPQKETLFVFPALFLIELELIGSDLDLMMSC